MHFFLLSIEAELAILSIENIQAEQTDITSFYSQKLYLIYSPLVDLTFTPLRRYGHMHRERHVPA